MYVEPPSRDAGRQGAILGEQHCLEPRQQGGTSLRKSSVEEQICGPSAIIQSHRRGNGFRVDDRFLHERTKGRYARPSRHEYDRRLRIPGADLELSVRPLAPERTAGLDLVQETGGETTLPADRQPHAVRVAWRGGYREHPALRPVAGRVEFIEGHMYKLARSKSQAPARPCQVERCHVGRKPVNPFHDYGEVGGRYGFPFQRCERNDLKVSRTWSSIGGVMPG